MWKSVRVWYSRPIAARSASRNAPPRRCSPVGRPPGPNPFGSEIAGNPTRFPSEIRAPIGDTKLAGRELLAKPSLNTEELIVTYVSKVIDDRGSSLWTKRDVEKTLLERVPIEVQQELLDEIIETYLAGHPIDVRGLVHLDMVRLEVEAAKT